MMRIVVLFVVAVCASATSVEAQVAQQVIVTSGGGLPSGASDSALTWGCCPDDVSHCLNLWSSYCQERRCHRVVSHRRQGLGHGSGHCGIFGNCGPACGCQSAPACESESCGDCVGSGCSANGSANGEPQEASGPPAVPPPLDSAEGFQDQPLAPPVPLETEDDPAIVPPEPTPDSATNSAGRWYLPFIWKK